MSIYFAKSFKIDFETLSASDVTTYSGVSITEFSCIKIAGIVTLSIVGKITTQNNTWMDVFRLPVGWRPNTNISPHIVIPDIVVGYDNIQTNGIYRGRYKSAGSNVNFNLFVSYRAE